VGSDIETDDGRIGFYGRTLATLSGCVQSRELFNKVIPNETQAIFRLLIANLWKNRINTLQNILRIYTSKRL